MRLRFAPSPTGFIHLANARIALLNYVYCLKHHGEFILRIDDTDIERSKPEYVDQIMTDMQWLNINYKEMLKQSDRYDIYNQVIDTLKKADIVYAAYETQEELKSMREKQLALKQAPRYKPLISSEQALKENRKPHWRFKLSNADISWEDEIMGKLSFSGRQSSDPIIMREDGSVPYILASIIDDYMMDISHIVRGRDHISNTAVQLQMLAVLNNIFGTNKQITFSHFPLISDLDGNVFSKREGSYALKNFQELGVDPFVIVRFLLQLGLNAPLPESINDTIASVDLHDMSSATQTKLTWEVLSRHIDWSKYGKGDLKCDTKQIVQLNAKHIANFNALQAKNWLTEHKCDLKVLSTLDLDWQTVWDVIKFEIKDIQDAKQWLTILHSILDSIPQNHISEALKTSYKDNATISTVLVAVKNAFLHLLQSLPEIYGTDKNTSGDNNIIKYVTKDMIMDMFSKIQLELPDCKISEINKQLRFLLIGAEHGPKIQELLQLFSVDLLLKYFSKL